VTLGGKGSIMPASTVCRLLARGGGSALALTSWSIAAAPVASAHAGGRAQLYIERFTVEPRPAAWDVEVTLTDADSGQPELGFAVSVSGTGPSGASFGPADLADGANRGRYSGAVRATPGRWTMLVNAHDRPGGPAAVAVSKRYEVTLTPGQPSDPGGSSATVAPAAHDSTASPLVLLAAAALIGACVAAAARPVSHRLLRP